MTLSEELQWRGFVNQTTFKDLSVLDDEPITFYWGVDPSADSMTIGNLAAAMMVRHFIERGHKAVLLVGGATGLIGDPDGKKQERDLLSLDDIARNKAALAEQYKRVFAGQAFEIVDNYDWFKEIGYLEFLRDVGKHVPMRQMLGRDFVQSRLGETGAGISYAEFSYSLIQGYDFLHLFRTKGVTLQVCGADQWGNSITGVDLIRRIEGKEAHVYSTPLVTNKTTGQKFGKSEDGAVWLEKTKTNPLDFYQFWINCDDEGVEEYLKIYTLLNKEELEAVMAEHKQNPKERIAQTRLAVEVTRLVHGEVWAREVRTRTELLIGKTKLSSLAPEEIQRFYQEWPRTLQASVGDEVIAILAATGLASSKTDARRLLSERAISINGEKTTKETLEADDFQNGFALIVKGKNDSALAEQV